MDASGRNPKKAVEMMKIYANWLLTQPGPIDEVLGYLVFSIQQQGLVYISGRDKKYHPIVIINIRRIIDSQIDISNLLKMDYIIFNWLIDNLLIPGKVETWVTIQDMNNVYAKEIPVKKIKALSEAFLNIYCQRIEKSFIINAPFLINTVWKVVRLFIAEETKKKVAIFRTGWEQALQNDISQDNLEEKYGGSLSNKISNFHPFLSQTI